MLDKKQKKKKVLPGNFILANANAAIELKKSCPKTTIEVTKKEFPKYLGKEALFQASIKLTKVIREGIILMGYESISLEGFRAVNTIHTRGNTAHTSPITQNVYVTILETIRFLCKEALIESSFFYEE